MGIVVTFYSYKGGVGRSFALANVAAMLAKRGLSVLAIDWDLEAPGLENYLGSGAQESPGLLNLLINSESDQVDYKDYLSEVSISESKISILPSGRAIDSEYSWRLQRFEWERFFARGGGERIEEWRNAWRRDFDITLIDSRTGLSDAGGVCSIQLPDVVVAMYTSNLQSLYGVRDTVQLARYASVMS